MHDEHLRLVIHAKLADGRLPHNLRRPWTSPSHGETCLACEQEIGNSEVLMQGIDDSGGTIQLHVECFWIWDSERTVTGR